MKIISSANADRRHFSHSMQSRLIVSLCDFLLGNSLEEEPSFVHS